MSFRILLVGLGNRGRMWGRIIAAGAETEFAGIVDTDAKRIETFCADHGPLPAFGDLKTAIAETRPDAVLLVTPPGGHLAQSRIIFEAGIPLLAEKPLTLDMKEAQEIVTAAEDAGVPLSVGLNFRYLSVSQGIKTLVAEKRFGDPNFAIFNYKRNRDWWRPGMNTYPQTMEHPMMLEQSVHHLDLIRYCYGLEVEEISCRNWNPPWSVYKHDANVSCQMTMEGGMEVHYVGTWTGGWNQLKFEWRTDCPEGVILQRELFSDLVTAATEDVEPTPVAIPDCVPFVDDSAALLDAFRLAIRNKTALPCTGADHLETLAVCFAAIESHETGRRVNMAEFRARHGLRKPMFSAA